jgi:uncharacterized protein (TIGR00375 family)
MRFITDFHIHSRYSRACSKALTLPNISRWCSAKGIDIVATGDYTHPAWISDIERQLEETEQGLYRVKPEHVKLADLDGANAAPRALGGRPVRFVLSTELSCIYKKGGATRRLHLVLMMPSVDAVKRFNRNLEMRGYNLRADGRPILGLDAKELLKLALEVDDRAFMIPAHAWTPWFSVFGSKSGFDSLEECFEEMTPHIRAIETGLSSDPPMNWSVGGLDDIVLVSHSDAHGLRNLGREANVMEFDAPSYDRIIEAMSSPKAEAMKATIEFFPEEGKYHADGCRECAFTCEPKETDRLGGRCPKCSKPITRGVLGRVHALAARKPGRGDLVRKPYYSVMPLEELIADVIGVGKASKAVDSLYRRLIESIGPEFDILIDTAPAAAARVDARIAAALGQLRRGEVRLEPGYDGVFGKVRLDKENRRRDRQGSLGL